MAAAAPDSATFLAAGLVFQKARRHAQASACFRRALEGWDADAQQGKDRALAVKAWWSLSQSCLALDDDAGAEDALRSAYALLQSGGSDDEPTLVEGFKEVHLNLSALLARRSGDDGRELLAEALGIIERGLSRCPFDPALGVQQGAVLRRLGQQAEALNRAWAALEYHRGRRQQQPQPTPPPSDPAAAPSQPEPAAAQALHVLMAKVGSKYPADHANRLARAVRRHLPLRAPPLRILCLTDDASGLDMEAIDEALPVPDAQLPGWWAKAHLFSPALPVPPGAPILYLDLDTVIVGDLRPLLGFFADAAAPTLAALSTEGLRSEGGRPRGLNTSVLLWRAHDPLWAPLSTDVGPEVVEVVRKLDWWVEMVAARAREERDGDGDGVLRVQERWPGLVVEYKDLIGLGGDGGCVWNQQPGEGAAVVVFPLRPKPADLVETVPWVQEHWR